MLGAEGRDWLGEDGSDAHSTRWPFSSNDSTWSSTAAPTVDTSGLALTAWTFGTEQRKLVADEADEPTSAVSLESFSI